MINKNTKLGASFQNRTTLFLSLAVLIVGTLLPVLASESVYAGQITNRSITLQAGSGGDGGSLESGTVNHLFDFTVPNVGDGNIGSIQFEYCTTAADVGAGTCTTPTGLDTTSAALGSESGATGFSINNATNGAPYITRTAASVTAGTALQYRLDDIVNPSAQDTYFVRISTYTSTDATGSAVDTGAVAFAINEQIVLSGTMPESLVFCTGETISTTGGVPDCSTATAGAVAFDRLFSPTDTALATSQMAASTNAGQGYSITVNGTTLTSGANTITAMAPSTTSTQGTSQFGMNLVVNTTPTVGTALTPASDGTDFNGVAQTDYDTADTFKFADGDVVANSNFDATGDPDPTDAQIFTKSYIVNVPGNQPAGTYTTTLTYICTATY